MIYFYIVQPYSTMCLNVKNLLPIRNTVTFIDEVKGFQVIDVRVPHFEFVDREVAIATARHAVRATDVDVRVTDTLRAVHAIVGC